MKQLFHEIKINTNGQGLYDFTEKTVSWIDKQKIDHVAQMISPIIEDKIDIIKSMGVETLNNDEKFHEKFSDKIYSLLALSSGGVIKIIPFFKKKFYASMIEVKNEIVEIDGEEISIRPDFKEKLPQAVLRGLKK